MKTHVVWKDIFGDFHMTTKENHLKMISNAREKWDFNKSQGFESVDDVFEYVEEFFPITRENIEIVD